MIITSYKVLCFESAAYLYGESPTFLTEEEAIKYMWDDPWGGNYYTNHSNKPIKTFEEMLFAYKSKKLNFIPEDDRKCYFIIKHEVDIKITPDMVGK